jgi:hypothetical protein
VGYCYQSLGDIVCYDAPQPNMTNPLSGYQGYPPSQIIQANNTVAAAPMPVVQTTQIVTPPPVIAVSDGLPEGEQAVNQEPLALMPRQ